MFIGCAWPDIGDAPDIGELGDKPVGTEPEVQTFGERLIIWFLLAAIVANIWGSDIVVNSSHGTPVSMVGCVGNSPPIGRSIVNDPLIIRNVFLLLNNLVLRRAI